MAAANLSRFRLLKNGVIFTNLAAKFCVLNWGLIRLNQLVQKLVLVAVIITANFMVIIVSKEAN